MTEFAASKKPSPRANPLVTVIVPTYNSQRTLKRCLASIRAQTYPSLELIVVDNFSRDATPEIASRYGAHVFFKGPERSAQRNFALGHAQGEYVLNIDSDMYLSEDLVATALERFEAGADAIILSEDSIGAGFWARCKWLERRCYQGEDTIEAVRMFRTQDLRQLGGYDPDFYAFEDWDLHNRVLRAGLEAQRADRVRALILHDEGELRFSRSTAKKRYYGGQTELYRQRWPTEAKQQLGIGARARLLLRHRAFLLSHPVLTCGMVILKMSEAWAAQQASGLPEANRP